MVPGGLVAGVWALRFQADALVADLDQSFFVQPADGPLKFFFAHGKKVHDVLGAAFIMAGDEPAALFQRRHDALAGSVNGDMAWFFKGKVDFAVFSDMADIARPSLADFHDS